MLDKHSRRSTRTYRSAPAKSPPRACVSQRTSAPTPFAPCHGQSCRPCVPSRRRMSTISSSNSGETFASFRPPSKESTRKQKAVRGRQVVRKRSVASPTPCRPQEAKLDRSTAVATPYGRRHEEESSMAAAAERFNRIPDRGGAKPKGRVVHGNVRLGRVG